MFRETPTARQLEVFATVVSAGGHKEAAGRLGLSRRTITAHLGELRGRLGCETTLQVLARLDDERPGWRSCT